MAVSFATSKTDFAFDISLKWTLAENLYFLYDYESGAILTTDSEEVGISEFVLLADNLEQRIKTTATFGNFSSNADAQEYFNLNVFNMLLIQNHEKYAMNYY